MIKGEIKDLLYLEEENSLMDQFHHFEIFHTLTIAKLCNKYILFTMLLVTTFCYHKFRGKLPLPTYVPQGYMISSEFQINASIFVKYLL